MLPMLVVTGLCGRELYFMFNSVKDTQEKSNFINVSLPPLLHHPPASPVNPIVMHIHIY